MINSQQKYAKNNNPSDRIRIILSETGFRQNQLAEAGNVKPPTLNGYLSGARPVGFDFAYALMKSLGYNPFWILFGDGDKKVPPEIFCELTRKITIALRKLNGIEFLSDRSMNLG
ncbi:helix-turn-helix domain-containing protein [Leptospira noguchii]|uniref:helix-turn-helix domain-containing protein n=1 Tax=Leptospira noguchii TaxID=28182 RepID=UPI001F05A44E|nr:helix-turn-helix domain-containing protein [Leptospira noguchii]MCH1915677.1 helix-turn-helix domain-containing protein [Leptospira noguchii]